MNILDAKRQTSRYAAWTTGLLSTPLVAFEAAWACDPPRSGKYQDSFKAFFAFALSSQCSGTKWNEMATLRGKPLDALGQFLITTTALLESWKPFTKVGGNSALAWCESNPEHFVQVQRSQRTRVAWIAEPDTNTRSSVEMVSLVVLRKFRGQRSFNQAATTAAYALWGDFLYLTISSVVFCPLCHKPFAFAARKQFCSKKCAKVPTSNRGHMSDVRADNWVKLQSESSKLHKWTVSRKTKLSYEGDASPRWMTRFIRAAKNPSDDIARLKLLDLCVEYGKDDNHRQNVCSILDHFLQDIVIAGL
jgi:hypothetical protein